MALAVWSLLILAPLTAETVWTLKSGPVAVPSIPLDPVQMVSAWRGLYSEGTEEVWVYATRSLQFFPPSSADVRALEETPWTVAVFFPPWKPQQRRDWLDRWRREFLTLYSLPDQGYPIVFPAVLRMD